PFSPTYSSASHRPSIALLPVATSTTDSVKFPSSEAVEAAGKVSANAPSLISSTASFITDLSALESGKYPLVVLLSGSVRAISDASASTTGTAVDADKRRISEMPPDKPPQAAKLRPRVRFEAPGGHLLAPRTSIASMYRNTPPPAA
ncbi:unnamed protein product, partial [Ectocarpus sp. 12 AP-2014]